MSDPGAIYRIRQTAAGLVHIHARHVRRDFPKYRGKSKFDPDADLRDLIRQAEHFEPALQPDGNYCRICELGRVIGTERHSGRATSILTVITRPNGDLVTAFPGPP